MKPNPFLLSHHLTLPLAIVFLSRVLSARAQKQKDTHCLVVCARESLLKLHTPQVFRTLGSYHAAVKHCFCVFSFVEGQSGSDPARTHSTCNACSRNCRR